MKPVIKIHYCLHSEVDNNNIVIGIQENSMIATGQPDVRNFCCATWHVVCSMNSVKHPYLNECPLTVCGWCDSDATILLNQPCVYFLNMCIHSCLSVIYVLFMTFWYEFCDITKCHAHKNPVCVILSSSLSVMPVDTRKTEIFSVAWSNIKDLCSFHREKFCKGAVECC